MSHPLVCPLLGAIVEPRGGLLFLLFPRRWGPLMRWSQRLAAFSAKPPLRDADEKEKAAEKEALGCPTSCRGGCECAVATVYTEETARRLFRQVKKAAFKATSRTFLPPRKKARKRRCKGFALMGGEGRARCSFSLRRRVSIPNASFIKTSNRTTRFFLENPEKVRRAADVFAESFLCLVLEFFQVRRNGRTRLLRRGPSDETCFIHLPPLNKRKPSEEGGASSSGDEEDEGDWDAASFEEGFDEHFTDEFLFTRSPKASAPRAAVQAVRRSLCAEARVSSFWETQSRIPGVEEQRALDETLSKEPEEADALRRAVQSVCAAREKTLPLFAALQTGLKGLLLTNLECSDSEEATDEDSLESESGEETEEDDAAALSSHSSESPPLASAKRKRRTTKSPLDTHGEAAGDGSALAGEAEREEVFVQFIDFNSATVADDEACTIWDAGKGLLSRRENKPQRHAHGMQGLLLSRVSTATVRPQLALPILFLPSVLDSETRSRASTAERGTPLPWE